SRVTLERPMLKDVKLKQRDGGVEHRPQVAITLCVGRTTLETTLTVSDRTGYTAPLTIGGDDVHRLGAVDPGREYTIEPNCSPNTDNAVLAPSPSPAIKPKLAAPAASHSPVPFSCDGRQYCSEMNSRAEAEFFARNCPDTKMDGDHDGEPCESDSRW
ncbi:MAG: RimK/LysX family protein, partial [Nevskia sp.]|nr:RimK/LysX family protein [Nevskia sp.]